MRPTLLPVCVSMRRALTCVWPNTLLSDSKLEKLVILRMIRDSMVHMRKYYRHLIKNTPSHGAV